MYNNIVRKRETMKTLKDYIKGYGSVPITLIASHIDKDGNKYYLVKQDGYSVYYYLKGDEVLKKEYIVNDHFENLALKYINAKNPETRKAIVKDIEEQMSYKIWVSFIKEQAGENVKL